jgi:hypothetical protein
VLLSIIGQAGPVILPETTLCGSGCNWYAEIWFLHICILGMLHDFTSYAYSDTQAHWSH